MPSLRHRTSAESGSKFKVDLTPRAPDPEGPEVGLTPRAPKKIASASRFHGMRPSNASRRMLVSRSTGTMPARRIVDASPLILLSKAGRLDLPRVVADQVIMPAAVLEDDDFVADVLKRPGVSTST